MQYYFQDSNSILSHIKSPRKPWRDAVILSGCNLKCLIKSSRGSLVNPSTTPSLYFLLIWSDWVLKVAFNDAILFFILGLGDNGIPQRVKKHVNHSTMLGFEMKKRCLVKNWDPVWFKRSEGASAFVNLSWVSSSLMILLWTPFKILGACWDATQGFSCSGKPDTRSAFAISLSGAPPPGPGTEGFASEAPWAEPHRSRKEWEPKTTYTLDFQIKLEISWDWWILVGVNDLCLAYSTRSIKDRLDVKVLHLALFLPTADVLQDVSFDIP